MTSTSKHKWLLPVILGILLLATAMRLYQLDAQSFWYDEGLTYGRTQRTVLEMIRVLQNNVHTPGYFTVLNLWENIAGSTEFALRFPSVLGSVVSIAATYALGKRLFAPFVGLVAAWVVTLNTFSIYYAQEARMYSLLAAISALSMWVFIGWLRRMHTRPLARWTLPTFFAGGGIAFALLNTVGAYTHYGYAFVMLTQGVIASGWLLTILADEGWSGRLWRGFIAYAGINVLTIGLFAPWLLTVIDRVSSQPNISEAVPFTQMLQTLLSWLVFGLTHEITLSSMLGVSALLLVGLVSLLHYRPRDWWQIALPVVWVLLSCGIYLALNFYERNLRFLLPTQIALALWLAFSLWRIWELRPLPATLLRYVPRLVAGVAMGWLTLSALVGWLPLYDDPAFQRDDYRGIAATIQTEARSGDAIILSAPGVQEIFNYYYDGSLPVYPLPAGEDIAAETAAIIDNHRRIYVVLYGNAEQDPDGVVLGTLNQQAYQINAQWIGDIRLMRYASPAEFGTLQESHTRFGEHITLLAYGLSETTVAPNDALQVRFRWMTDAPLEQRYRIFLQLLDADGQLVAQRDSEPGGGTQLTIFWEPETVIVDNHALSIPADLSSGEYTLIVGWYDIDDPTARLPVATDTDDEQTYLELTTVTVE